jgi:hypothetical protein
MKPLQFGSLRYHLFKLTHGAGLRPAARRS